MKTFGKYLEEKNKGLWDNIHAKRKRGEKMRKPGSKGAPTDADFKRSQEESVAEEQKLDEISQKKKDDYVAKASADRQSAWVKKGMADRTKDTKTSDAMKKKMAKRDKGMYRAMGEQNLDITEISLDMLTKKISNSGMATTKKANKMDKTKDDLAALKARLAGKPAMAKEAYEDGMNEASQLRREDTYGMRHGFAVLQESFIKTTTFGSDYKKKSGDFNTNLPNRMYTFIDNDDHSILVQIVNSEASFGVFELKDPRKPSAYPQDHKLTAKNKPLLVKSFDKVFYVLLQGIKKHNVKEIKIDGNYPRGMSREYDKLIANKAFLQEFKKVGMEYTGKVGDYYHFAKTKNKSSTQLRSEATELDELNKKTLGSYIKKASGSAAGVAAVTSAQAAIKGKSNPDDRRQLRNRLTGISRATDKVTKEEVDEAKRKGAPKMTGDSFAIQRAKDAELNKALGRTKTGRKKPARQMTSTQRSLASLRNEAVVSADKKPEKFVKPDGTVGIRMARVDNQVIKKDA